MRIHVAQAVGPLCITADDGATIYELIDASLSANRPVAIDFAGCEIFASPFFNSAIGPLVQTYEAALLNTHLSFENLTPDAMDLMRRVIENAREYHEKPEIRSVVDAHVASISGEWSR